MKENALYIAAIFLLACIYFGYDYYNKLTEHRKIDAVHLHRIQLENQIAEKYSAHIFKSRDNITTLYLEQELLNHKPTIFPSESITDIYKKGEIYYVSFLEDTIFDNSALLVTLECEKDKAAVLDKDIGKKKGSYIVVAQINSVHKNVPSYNSSEKSSDFTLTGSCVDFLRY